MNDPDFKIICNRCDMEYIDIDHIYCPGCNSCQICPCCPCYKPGCEWCEDRGQFETEDEDVVE